MLSDNIKISENININPYQLNKIKEWYEREQPNDITLADKINTSCAYCVKQCIHKDAYRRMPRSCGGLGLCENLEK